MALAPTSSPDPLLLPTPPTSLCTCSLLPLLKSAIHNLIFSNACRSARSLSMASAVTFRSLRRRRHSTAKTKGDIRNIFFGSFRMHYNWCSSHVVPAPPAIEIDLKKEHMQADAMDLELWRYLECVEGGESEDIDELAEVFIAKCHEKFRLEKQESYRRRRGGNF